MRVSEQSHGVIRRPTHRIVWHGHQVRDKLLLCRLVGLRCNHIPDGFVERVHLQRLKVCRYPVQCAQNLVDERLRLSRLPNDEVPPAFLRNLDERVAGHVLHTLVCLVHELEQL